ncbi:MAG: C4-dicarboxylate ABC transporter permease [Acidobacteria bacterium]|nr:C4-dicarboxylate ABC transporter permease [Acidobacteriota bacterium]
MEIGFLIAAIAGLLLLLASGLWISVVLFVVGFGFLHFGIGLPAGPILATSTWGFANNWTLTALPMFVLMGELLFRSKLAEELFMSLSPWVRNLPGGLLHVNVIGCGVFSAVSGSSTATTATIGRMTLPRLREAGCDDGLSIGSLAASGTFGLLVPPSGMLIVYAFLTETSIVKLFAAGILPAIMMMALFSLFLAAASLWRGDKPRREGERIPFIEKLRLTRHFLPMITLIFVLMLSMYRGWATATEAGALGVVGALALLAYSRALTVSAVVEATAAAVRTSCMILFVLAGASYLSTAVGLSGLPDDLAAAVGRSGIGPYALIAVLTLMYVVLGLFLDGLSMIVLTASTVIPVVNAAGFDPVWFGIYVVLVVEMSLITPPVGLNLFVLQSIAGVDSLTVARAALPFFFLMLLSIAIILLFPQIVLLLPAAL